MCVQGQDLGLSVGRRASSMIGITVLVETIWRHKREGGQQRRSAHAHLLAADLVPPAVEAVQQQLGQVSARAEEVCGVGKGAKGFRGVEGCKEAKAAIAAKATSSTVPRAILWAAAQRLPACMHFPSSTAGSCAASPKCEQPAAPACPCPRASPTCSRRWRSRSQTSRSSSHLRGWNECGGECSGVNE